MAVHWANQTDKVLKAQVEALEVVRFGEQRRYLPAQERQSARMPKGAEGAKAPANVGSQLRSLRSGEAGVVGQPCCSQTFIYIYVCVFKVATVYNNSYIAGVYPTNNIKNLVSTWLLLTY